MAKKMYLGVDGIARKIKKGYIGVDGIARKVKKGYIGVGGMARLFWTGDGISYFGETTGILYTATKGSSFNMTAASNEEYLIMGTGYRPGGYTDYNATSTVYAFNKSLTYAKTSLYRAENVAGLSTDDYAIFAGGGYHVYDTYSNPVLNNVSYFDKSLTKSAGNALLTRRQSANMASVGNCFLVAGGNVHARADGYINYTNSVEMYDFSFTRQSPSTLKDRVRYCAALTVGNHALFCGGEKYVSRNDDEVGYSVTAFDSSLTRTYLADMEIPLSGWGGMRISACVSIGQYGFIHNGANYALYDESLTVNYVEDALVSAPSCDVGAGVSFEDMVFIPGIYAEGKNRKSIVYDASITKSEIDDVLPIGVDDQYSYANIVRGIVGNYIIYAPNREGSLDPSIVFIKN